MTVLPNFPKVSQLSNITSDGEASENREFDCVPASIAACILWYEGKSQWDNSINPDMLKDAAYGESYSNNGTAASAYIPICGKLGYKLYEVQASNNTQLVTLAHQYIQSQKPVVFTEPDPYASVPGWSHVCVFHADRPGYLTCLDPYIAQDIERPDQTWEEMLLFGSIWIVEPLATNHSTVNPPQNGDILPLLQLTDPMGKYFVQIASTRWHCPQTNNDIAYAHLDFYRQYQGILGLPRTGEIYLAQFPGTAIQVYERGIAAYDPDDKIPNEKPPGSGNVYLLHIDSGVGQQIIAKPLLAELQNQVANFQGQIKNLQSQITVLEEQNATLSDTSELQTKLASYETAIKTIINALLPVENQLEGKTA